MEASQGTCKDIQEVSQKNTQWLWSYEVKVSGPVTFQKSEFELHSKLLQKAILLPKKAGTATVL